MGYTLNKRIVIFGVITILGFGLFHILLKLNQRGFSLENDRIIFQRVVDPSMGRYELFIMDRNGNNIQWLTETTGPAAWSNDGKYIATECFNYHKRTQQMCIYDVETIPDFRNKAAQPYDPRPDIHLRVDFPVSCKVIMENTETDSGILSLSWSPDNESLALVCDGETPEGLRQKEVCILSLTGSASCWNDQENENVYQVAWSPKDNILAVSGLPGSSSKIFLVNPDGSNARFLTDGWAPEWSSDGQRIAFIRHASMGYDGNPTQTGIATIKKDGSDMQWIRKFDNYLAHPNSIFFSRTGINHLAWFPDGKYIAFIAGAVSPTVNHIFLLDVSTGELTNPLQRSVIGNDILYPDCGKYIK